MDPYGLRRVVSPKGALPQRADALDPALPLGDDELSIEVEALNVDAASFRQIESAAGGDPARIADDVLRIVQARGKLHNPVTGSGGMLIECAKYVERHGGDPRKLTLHGQENNLGTWAICKMNMLLHGLPDARIEKGDTIRDPRLGRDVALKVISGAALGDHGCRGLVLGKIDQGQYPSDGDIITVKGGLRNAMQL